MKLQERSPEARLAYFDGYRAGVEAALRAIDDTKVVTSGCGFMHGDDAPGTRDACWQAVRVLAAPREDEHATGKDYMHGAPPAPMLTGARFDRIHKEVGKYRPARVGKPREATGCDACRGSRQERVAGRDGDEIVIPCSMCCGGKVP